MFVVLAFVDESDDDARRSWNCINQRTGRGSCSNRSVHVPKVSPRIESVQLAASRYFQVRESFWMKPSKLSCHCCGVTGRDIGSANALGENSAAVGRLEVYGEDRLITDGAIDGKA